MYPCFQASEEGKATKTNTKKGRCDSLEEEEVGCAIGTCTKLEAAMGK